MQVTIKLFGAEAKAVGSRTAMVDLPSQTTCAAIRRVLAERYPPLQERLGACRFAVNHEFVDDQTTVTARDEIALIGQVSGG